jgi:hypothetical protein
MKAGLTKSSPLQRFWFPVPSTDEGPLDWTVTIERRVGRTTSSVRA